MVTACVSPLIRHDGNSWRALGISAGFALSLSGLFAVMWLRRFVPLWAAAGAAICYMFLPYHLLIVLYRRGAFAEFWAMSLMPLVLGCAHSVADGRRNSTLMLAFAYALLISSHLPTTLVFSLIPPMYAMLIAYPGRKCSAGLMTAAGMILGIGLSGVFLIPALTLQEAVSIEKLTQMYKYEHYFLRSEFVLVNPLLWENRVTPLAFWSVVSMLASAGCALALCLRNGPTTRKRQALFWFGATIISALMMMPLSKPAWVLLPTLQIIQFPWRFSTVTSIATAALLALAMASIKEPCSWPRIAFAQIIWTIVIGWIYATILGVLPLQGQTVSTMVDPLLRDVPEYRPRWVQADLQSTLAKFKGEGDSIDKVAFATGEGSGLIEQWKPRNNVLVITVPAPSTVLVRQYYYPGWTARVNGEPHVVQISAPDGLVQLSLPAGVHRVELRLERTKQELWGWIITWTSLLIAAGLLLSQWLLKAPGSGVASALAMGGGDLAADRKRAE
jgi:hypothetical protein